MEPVSPIINLAGLILKGLEQGDRDGALSGISVPGFMQIIEAEQKSCLLTIHAHGKKQGLMFFFEGKLYDAICGRLKGEDAAIKLIGLSDAHIENQKLSGKKDPQTDKYGGAASDPQGNEDEGRGREQCGAASDA